MVMLSKLYWEFQFVWYFFSNQYFRFVFRFSAFKCAPGANKQMYVTVFICCECIKTLCSDLVQESATRNSSFRLPFSVWWPCHGPQLTRICFMFSIWYIISAHARHSGRSGCRTPDQNVHPRWVPNFFVPDLLSTSTTLLIITTGNWIDRENMENLLRLAKRASVNFRYF